MRFWSLLQLDSTPSSRCGRCGIQIPYNYC